MAESEEATKVKAKRVRRGFAQIITEKIAKKYENYVEPAKLAEALNEVKRIVTGLDAQKKEKRKNYSVLDKFTEEEAMAYYKSKHKNNQ